MNENLNLVKILKDCPEGTKLYSPVYGDVELEKVIQVEDDFLSSIEDDIYPIKIKLNNNSLDNFTKDGRMFVDYNGECMLFPSKDQRDWSKFTAPWLERQIDKDKLIQELGEYKVKYTQEVLGKYINSIINKDDERLRKTTIAFLKDFAEQGYENAIECINWLKKQGKLYEKIDSMKILSDPLPKKPKFDPKTFQPFDKVLVRRGSENCDVWFPDFVSSPPDDTNNKTLCMCIMEDIAMVIPYNDDTKHLDGTSDEAPEFYRYWED